MHPGRPPAQKERKQEPAFEWPPAEASLAPVDGPAHDASLTPATTTSDVHARRLARSDRELAVVPASLSLPRRQSRRSPFAVVAGLLALTVTTLIVIGLRDRSGGAGSTEAGPTSVYVPDSLSTSGEAQSRRDMDRSSLGRSDLSVEPAPADVGAELNPPPHATPAPDVARAPAAPVSGAPLPALPEQRTAPPRFAAESTTAETVLPPPAEPSAEDRQAINRILDQYRDAFDRRSADDVRTLWPSVDRNALARAFSGLKSQALFFDGCVLAISEVAASAVCDGLVRYVPRVGGNSEREQPGSWNFTLERRGPGWSILNVAVR